MKAKFYMLRCIYFSLLLLFPAMLFSQNKIAPDNPLYDKMKAEGKLPESRNGFLKPKTLPEIIGLKISPEIQSTSAFFKACKEFIPVDTTFLVVPFQTSSLGPPPFYRNDDASTAKITLPFNFCFYGNSFNQLYINNNGNISFDGPQNNYRPDSLPTTGFMALAPFWADVDTRNFNSGVVYYKITPTYMIVTWDSVGYYNTHSDKRNSFQLIITNGVDSTYNNPGKNVGFRYATMEWSTGDIGGTNGFSNSTTHATVGANKSDSIHFVQFGRFGVPGSNYDGPYAGTDGVSWLNGRVLEFNVCSGTNIEPIVNNFNYCDTIYSCVGDTNSFDLSFLSPEQNQITSTIISTTATSGLSVIQNTPGIVNTIKAKFIGDFLNVGYQHITFSASDNGTTPASTILDITIKVEPLNIAFLITGGGINICPGTTTPLYVTAGFDKYKWSNNAITNPMNAPPGNYYVTGKLGKCYLRSDTVHIGTIPVTIPIVLGNTTPQLCLEDSALLSVSGSFPHYLWSNGDTTQSAYLHPGYPFVIIIDTNSCAVKSANFHVPQFAMKPLNILGIKSICPEDSLTISASPGFTNYLWNTGNLDTSITVPPGFYSVTATDTNNCKNYSLLQSLPAYQVTQPAIIGKREYCLGNSVQLSIFPNYLHYYWNTGDTLNTLVAQQGMYFLMGIDNHHCKAFSDTISVNQLPVIPLTINGNMHYCPGDSSLLMASSGFTEYNWNFAGEGQTVYVYSGSYSVTATDTNGCVANSAIVEVIESQVSIPLLTGNLIACPGDSTLLFASAGFVGYNWSSGDSTNPVKVPSGNYFVIARDSNSCKTQSANVSVQNFFVSTPVISGNSLCCFNDSIVLSASSGFVQYNWSSGNINQNALLPSGNYFVQVTDSNNCKTVSTNFSLNPYPYTFPLVYGANFYCNGDSVLLSVSPSFMQYHWSNGTNQQVSFVHTGTHYVSITDTNNCVLRSPDFIVQQFPVQVPQILGNHFYCVSDSILLECTPGFYQHHWSNGKNSISIYAQSGNYSLIAADANNCKSYSLPFSVATSNPLPKIAGVLTICEDDSIPLSLTNSFAGYSWNTGSQLASIYAKQGIYYVNVLDSIGCKASDTVSVASYALPKVLFTFEPLIPEANENVQFFNASQSTSGTIISYSWSVNNVSIFSSESNPLYVFTDSGNYVVHLTVTTSNGCSDSYSENIHVIKSIKIPNIITPNGDGSNDVFEISNLNLSQANHFTVFDRWGKIIFSSNNYRNDWKAEKIKDGVYYYSLRLAGEREIKGSLSVLR